MSKRKREATTSEDDVVLPREAQNALDSLYRTPTVSEMLQVFNGSKKELVIALAGTSNTKSKEYTNAQRSINRYLQGTRGKRGLSEEMRNKFDSIINARGERETFINSPKNDMNVTISGTIGYDDNVRQRTLNFTLPAHLAIQVLQQAVENPHRGYADLMSVYFQSPLGSNTPITVYSGDGLTVDFS